MKAIANTELAKFLDGLKPAAEQFEPTAIHDPDGNCIEFLFAPDDFFAERIDDVVTVYYSRESGDLIGSLIKNVSGIKEKLPGVFGISLDDGKVKLSHLFVAVAASLKKDDKPRILIYKKLTKAAEDASAEAELCLV